MAPETPTAPPRLRSQIVHAALVLFALALIGRAGYVQLWEHDLWAARGLRHQFAESSIPAPRGDIEDETGLAIAYSRELVRVEIAPGEVKDIAQLGREMRRVGMSNADVRRATDTKRKWVTLRDRYLASRVVSLARLNGVHLTSVGDRVYVQSAGTRQLLGAVGALGVGVSGLELQLDSLLQGRAGRARTVKGLRGQRFESPETIGEPPTSGHTVRLTINQTLQNICDKALLDAVGRLRADGGDVVVLDPRTGEIRCLAGRRRAPLGGVSALIEPYEPGSTLKPFLAARLLERGKASPDEEVETFNGRLEIEGRVITDTHKALRLSLRDVIRFSSNVGIVQFAQRLTDGELYETLRDLGLGTPTSTPYPSEAAGTLRDPRRWSAQSHASIAIGYEVTVTPLQLALAYGALANGGELMAPVLVSEVRNGAGEVVFQYKPRVVRRVFDRKAVETVIPMLESVVESGTAVDAGLTAFSLAGKSGTARRTVGGAYGTDTYTSTFVGIFPAKDPQYVVLAKIDNPREESIYGGKVAAPLTKVVIEGALAARDASLDWSQLASQKREVELTPSGQGTVAASGGVEADTLATPVPPVAWIDSTPLPDPSPSVTFDLARPLKDRFAPSRAVSVPDVRGLPLRVAVRQLHRAGLQVTVIPGTGATTLPGAGRLVPWGSVVRLTRP